MTELVCFLLSIVNTVGIFNNRVTFLVRFFAFCTLLIGSRLDLRINS